MLAKCIYTYIIEPTSFLIGTCVYVLMRGYMWCSVRVLNNKAQDEMYTYGIGFCPNVASYGDGGQGWPSSMR